MKEDRYLKDRFKKPIPAPPKPPPLRSWPQDVSRKDKIQAWLFATIGTAVLAGFVWLLHLMNKS